jgi:alkanesulfonate monooxygenase SsuD/methylene tetrahydromethanopterin reductase-like flavin-dependent oxidoreductase (luciferase family)
MRALGYDPKTRGRRLDDGIGVLRDCWSGETRGALVLPKPTQPAIPILVGGKSGRALTRAASLGDGWIPDAAIDRLDCDALAASKDELTRRREAAGRADSPFEHVLVVDGCPDRVDGLAAIARRSRATGFDELVIEVPFEDPPRARAIIASARASIDD